jgi:PKD repeat protein
MRLRWSDTTAWYENDISPASQNLTEMDHLQFRAGVNFAQTTSGTVLNFSVAVVDSAGDSSTQVVSSRTHALYYPPGAEPSISPKVLFNTISLPLSGFTGVDMSKIRKVKFKMNKSTAGSLLISDLAVAGPVCGKLNAAYTATTSGHTATFTNGTVTNNGDTVTRLWSFGDAASGTSDTSSALNPAHYYAGYGTHTVCLYVRSGRKSGYVCADTFCTTVSLTPPAVVDQQVTQEITVYPNPAANYLIVDGAEKTDVLRLFNVYGQEVFAVMVNDRTVSLPQNIANGVYYVVIQSDRKNFYQKLVISR